jgi:RNA polymerase sigma-70 factor, ECF subfamily
MNRSDTFQQHRPLLFSIAYRMLGSVMDAEDMVQEAFLRWQAAGDAEISYPKAYLSAIVTRLCIDFLRSASVQREQYVGPWLPEPIVTGMVEEAADPAALADSLSLAFLILLESLSPEERAVFLLRELFDYEYREIANIIGKSEANCRQMLARARRHIESRRPRFDASAEARQRLLQQFVQTCTVGDMDGMLAMLEQDVVLRADGGGKARAALRPIAGSDKVARYLLGLLRQAPPGWQARPAAVNGQPGIITYVDGNVQSALAFDICDGRIQAIYMVVNPDKLHSLPPLTGPG